MQMLPKLIPYTTHVSDSHLPLEYFVFFDNENNLHTSSCLRSIILSQLKYVWLYLVKVTTLWPKISNCYDMSGAVIVVLGLVLLFILPRHTFACVQSALFPKYMILNGVTALAVLISFVQTKKVWSSQENYQVNIEVFLISFSPYLFCLSTFSHLFVFFLFCPVTLFFPNTQDKNE